MISQNGQSYGAFELCTELNIRATGRVLVGLPLGIIISSRTVLHPKYPQLAKLDVQNGLRTLVKSS